RVSAGPGLFSIRATPAVANRYGTSNNGIVVILDCSGSMYDNVDPTKPRPANLNARSPETRFHAAREALKRMLQQIPDGTQVSVWTFSQMNGPPAPTPGIDKGVPFLHPRNVEENRNVYSSIRPMVRMGPWSRAQWRNAEQQIDALVAYNSTPLVRTILEARQDLNAVEGLKTIIVLTDGMDNCFERRSDNPENSPDPKWNADGRLKIPDVLKQQFGKDSPYSNVKLVIVGFQLPEAEKPLALESFVEPLKSLPEPGEFVLVDQTDGLDAVLRNASKQLLGFRLQDAVTLQEVRLSNPATVQTGGGLNFWKHPLPRGSYRAVVQNQHQTFELQGGEHFIMEVDAAGTEGLLFRRHLWSDDFDAKELKEEGGWRLSVVHQAAPAPTDREIWATLEETANRQRSASDALNMPMPRFVWHELKGTGATGRAPRRLTWENTPLLPASVWRLRGTWQAKADIPARQQLTTWLLPQTPAPFHTLRRETSERLEAWAERQRGPVPLAGSTEQVAVESIEVEKHALPEFGDAQPRDYLVVRLRFSSGQPVFAQINRRLPAVHAFYSEAGRYAGYFQIGNVESELEAVSLYSVDQLKDNRATTKMLTVPLG
ncbi:MAG TPA: VWA domain-containing protein, partial [Gemmatales bacterium]|nr:VWA domain-containing protein [Gemmatales bacterium]